MYIYILLTETCSAVFMHSMDRLQDNTHAIRRIIF